MITEKTLNSLDSVCTITMNTYTNATDILFQLEYKKFYNILRLSALDIINKQPHPTPFRFSSAAHTVQCCV